MIEAGKMMVAAGLVLLLIGAAVWALGGAGFRGLAGDIRFETPHVRVYFPIVTCLVLSALLTGAMWLWQWLARR